MPVPNARFTTADETVVALMLVDMGNGVFAPAHVVTDAGGIPISAANPLRMAPGVAAVDFTDRSGQVGTPGQSALDIAANPVRKGGWLKALVTNGGTLTVTLKKPDGTASVHHLAPGELFSFIVNPGYVYQGELVVSGDTTLDRFDGVEFA